MHSIKRTWYLISQQNLTTTENYNIIHSYEIGYTSSYFILEINIIWNEIIYLASNLTHFENGCDVVVTILC